MVSSTLAWEEGCAFMKPSALQPASACNIQLYLTAGACLCSAGLLASSLAGSILLCLKVSATAFEGIAPPQSSPGPFPVASGRFMFLPTRWAAPLVPPKQQLSSQHCPVSCHLGPQVPSATLFQIAGRRSQGTGKKKSCRPWMGKA